jgi:probable rRNA maturation factor
MKSSGLVRVKFNMEINVLTEEGLEVETSSDWMQEIVSKTLSTENLPPNIEISLVITGQERIRELNKEYRDIDSPTDVLSFSMSEHKDEEQTAFIGPPDGLVHLGEVIVSYPQAQIQARERGHSLNKEMAILIIHGVLHILGFDHEKPEMEPSMTAREQEILSDLESRKEIA